MKASKCAFVLGLVAFLWAGLCQAQIVNVQQMLNQNKEGLQLSFVGVGDWRVGNVNFTLAEGSVLMRFLHARHLLLVTGSGAYSANDEERFIARAFGHLRYRFFFLRWLGLETFGQAEYDEFRQLSLRGLAGAGLVFRGSVGKLFKFTFGTTYMFEINRFSGDFTYPDGNKEKIFHRWNNYVNLELRLKKYLQVTHTTYFQPEFANFADWRLLMDTTLGIKVAKWLSITISHVLAYQSRPPVSPTDKVEPLDSALRVGLKGSFYLWKPKQRRKKRKKK